MSNDDFKEESKIELNEIDLFVSNIINSEIIPEISAEIDDGNESDKSFQSCLNKDGDSEKSFESFSSNNEKDDENQLKIDDEYLQKNNFILENQTFDDINNICHEKKCKIEKEHLKVFKNEENVTKVCNNEENDMILFKNKRENVETHFKISQSSDLNEENQYKNDKINSGERKEVFTENVKAEERDAKFKIEKLNDEASDTCQIKEFDRINNITELEESDDDIRPGSCREQASSEDEVSSWDDENDEWVYDSELIRHSKNGSRLPKAEISKENLRSCEEDLKEIIETHIKKEKHSNDETDQILNENINIKQKTFENKSRKTTNNKEDKIKDPSIIPTSGKFFMHDLREGDEKSNNNKKNIKQVKKDEGRWKHDLFNPDDYIPSKQCLRNNFNIYPNKYNKEITRRENCSNQRSYYNKFNYDYYYYREEPYNYKEPYHYTEEPYHYTEEPYRYKDEPYYYKEEPYYYNQDYRNDYKNGRDFYNSRSTNQRYNKSSTSFKTHNQYNENNCGLKKHKEVMQDEIILFNESKKNHVHDKNLLNESDAQYKEDCKNAQKYESDVQYINHSRKYERDSNWKKNNYSNINDSKSLGNYQRYEKSYPRNNINSKDDRKWEYNNKQNNFKKYSLDYNNESQRRCEKYITQSKGEHITNKYNINKLTDIKIIVDRTNAGSRQIKSLNEMNKKHEYSQKSKLNEEECPWDVSDNVTQEFDEEMPSLSKKELYDIENRSQTMAYSHLRPRFNKMNNDKSSNRGQLIIPKRYSEMCTDTSRGYHNDIMNPMIIYKPATYLPSQMVMTPQSHFYIQPIYTSTLNQFSPPFVPQSSYSENDNLSKSGARPVLGRT